MDGATSLPSNPVSVIDFMTSFDPVDHQLGLSGEPAEMTQLPATWSMIDDPIWSHFSDVSSDPFANTEAFADSADGHQTSFSTDTTAPLTGSAIDSQSFEKTHTKGAKNDSPKHTSGISRSGDDSGDVNDGSSTAEEDGPRRTQLKRNRIAATKCREKKKARQYTLEEQKHDLEAHQYELQTEYNHLRDEASHMKNALMAHAGCGDLNIEAWLENKARSFVNRADIEARSRSNAGRDGRPQ